MRNESRRRKSSAWHRNQSPLREEEKNAVQRCAFVFLCTLHVHEHVQISRKAKMKTQIAEKERGRERAKTLLNFTKLFIDNNLYNMGGIEQC